MAAIPNSVSPHTFSNSHSWNQHQTPRNQQQTPRNQHQGPPAHNRNPNRPSAHPKPPHLPTHPQCQLWILLNSRPCLLLHQNIKIPGSLIPDHHLTHSAQTLSHVQPYSDADQVTIGDGQSLPIHNTDQVTKKTLLQGYLKDGLYEFPSSSSTRAFLSTSSILAGALWHSRLGHPVAPILSKALASCIPPVSFQLNKMPPCTIFHLVKSHTLHFSLSSSHATQSLALIHIDL
ncbi:hypothetical protein AAG906_020430 [Vitis piasezkii]